MVYKNAWHGVMPTVVWIHTVFQTGSYNGNMGHGTTMEQPWANALDQYALVGRTYRTMAWSNDRYGAQFGMNKQNG